jgi:hypothetical protein
MWKTSVRGRYCAPRSRNSRPGDARSDAHRPTPANLVSQFPGRRGQLGCRSRLVAGIMRRRVHSPAFVADRALCRGVCCCRALQRPFAGTVITGGWSPLGLDDRSLAVPGVRRERRADQHLSRFAHWARGTEGAAEYSRTREDVGEPSPIPHERPGQRHPDLFHGDAIARPGRNARGEAGHPWPTIVLNE